MSSSLLGITLGGALAVYMTNRFNPDQLPDWGLPLVVGFAILTVMSMFMTAGSKR